MRVQRLALGLGCLAAALACAMASAMLALSGAPEALQNGGFEAGTIDGWAVAGGSAAAVTSPVAEGDYAAQLSADGPGAVVRLSQPVDVTPGAGFQLAAQMRTDGSDVADAYVQLTWRDAGGTAWSWRSDALAVTGVYQALSTAAAVLPCDAVDPAVAVVLQRASGAPAATAFVDDVRLTLSPPDPPCAVDTPTIEPSATPHEAAASPSSTASPSATPVTPSATAASTSTPTPSATAASTSTPTRTPTPLSTATHTPNATSTPTPVTPTHGLIVNGGFELPGAGGGAPFGWATQGGVAGRVEEPVWAGEHAAAFASATTSTKWLHQVVPVTPGAWYEARAHLLHDDPNVGAAWLRVSWYASDDGGGSAIDSVDSTATLDAPNAAYRALTTGPVPAPPDARSARVRIMLRPRSDAAAIVFADEVWFSPAEAPPATATPSPSATRTATPSPSATRTWTPPPPPVATATPSAVPSPLATATGVPFTATPSPRPAATATSTATPPDGNGVSGPLAEPTPSHGMLVNGGFEHADDSGGPAGWRKQGGLVARVDAPVFAGAAAGSFYSASDSTKWLYQTVGVTPGGWYDFSAQIFHGDPWVDVVWLRVSWYASDDGSGSAVDSIDSLGVLDAPAAAYRPLTTGPVQAPPGVRSAKARIMLRPRDATGAVIFVDEAWFVPSAQPPLPPDDGSGETPDGEGIDDEPGPQPRRSSTGGSTAGASRVASASRGALPPDPQPTPVIVRDALLSEAGAGATSGSPPEWALWAGVIAVGAGTGTAGWALRRRATP